jgi:hypothetical protein
MPTNRSSTSYDSSYPPDGPRILSSRKFPAMSASGRTAAASLASRALPRSLSSLSPPLPVSHTTFSLSVDSMPVEVRKAAAVAPEKYTCSECGDVFYQPLLLVGCLHTFCGHCAKKRLDVAWECPTCHRAPQLTQPNWPKAEEVDAFLRKCPVRDRSPSEKIEISSYYNPEEPLLPPGQAAVAARRSAKSHPPSFDPESRRLVAGAELAPALAKAGAVATAPAPATSPVMSRPLFGFTQPFETSRSLVPAIFETVE